MAARVLFSPRAEADLESIGDFIALDDRPTAVRFVRTLRERSLSLEELPERGVPFGKGTRALVVGSYLILYQVRQDEAQQLVVIAAVVHASRVRKRPSPA